MKGLRERWLAALGVAVVVAGLLAFTIATPSKTIGFETDVPTIEDPGSQGPTTGDTNGENANPPASLPDAGTGFQEDTSVRPVLLIGMLAALGVTLGGAGLVAARQTRRVEDR